MKRDWLVEIIEQEFACNRTFSANFAGKIRKAIKERRPKNKITGDCARIYDIDHDQALADYDKAIGLEE